MSRGVIRSLAIFVSISLPLRAGAGEVQIFVNQYSEWLAASNYSVRTIDFETLPNGSPTQYPTPLTLEYNYTDSGVVFSPPYPIDFFGIAGNVTTGFELRATSISAPRRAWIVGDLVRPTRSVGIFFPGGTALSAFDEQGNLLAQESYGAPLGGHFMGFVSTIPIARITTDDGGSGDSIEAFLFDPVPEPATAMLIGSGMLAWLLRRRRWIR